MNEITKLASTTIAGLDLEELAQGYRRRLLILDGQIAAFKDLETRYSEKLAEMDGAVKELKSMYHVFQALYRISCQLLSKAEVPTEPKGPPSDDEEKDINQKLTDWH